MILRRIYFQDVLSFHDIMAVKESIVTEVEDDSAERGLTW